MMNDPLKNHLAEVDKDLSNSWIELSKNVRDLANDLKLKTTGTVFASDADHLSRQTSRLCDHVAKFQTDVIDLIEKIEIHLPDPEPDTNNTAIPDPKALDREKIQIQRENHELRSDFKDVLKALFMWVDDPKERLKSKL
jgi:hypothetical protein